MLAYNGYSAGWGGPTTKVIQDLDLDTGRSNFEFPDRGGQKGADITEAPNIKSQRSISAPNVSHTIINPESFLPESFKKIGNIQKDHVRSKLN